MSLMTTLPASIDATVELLERGNYVADRALATTLFLALKLGRRPQARPRGLRDRPSRR